MTQHRVGGRGQQFGVAMVEFALVAPLFFLVLFGIVEFARAGLAYNSAAGAARDGARTLVAAQEAGSSYQTLQTDLAGAVSRSLGGSTILDTTIHPYPPTAQCSGGQPGHAYIFASPDLSSATNVPGGTAHPTITVEVCIVFQPIPGLLTNSTGTIITIHSTTTMKTEY